MYDASFLCLPRLKHLRMFQSVGGVSTSQLFKIERKYEQQKAFCFLRIKILFKIRTAVCSFERHLNLLTKKKEKEESVLLFFYKSGSIFFYSRLDY